MTLMIMIIFSSPSPCLPPQHENWYEPTTKIQTRAKKRREEFVMVVNIDLHKRFTYAL